jgi:nicotinamide-nucleotide amidase
LSTDFPSPIMTLQIYNPNIFNDMRLEDKVSEKFIRRAKTLAIAESCTGGLISDRLTNRPGASAFFLTGIIAYDNAAKVKILKVPRALLRKHGSVSEPAAMAMARGVRQILNADYGLSVTGIAGPAGGSAAKPVGLVFIAVSSKQKTTAHKFAFKGKRLAVKKQAAETALKMLAQAFE